MKCTTASFNLMPMFQSEVYRYDPGIPKAQDWEVITSPKLGRSDFGYGPPLSL